MPSREFPRGLSLALCGLLLPALTAEAVAAKPVAPAAELFVYSAPDGDACFAIAVKAQEALAGAERTDHVILVDTSASQIGEHRQQTLDVTRAFVESLPAGDRVCVLAVDVAAKPLTDGFVRADGEAAAAAMKQLSRRVPLGATDLAVGLEAALQQFDSETSGSILYVGDGMSAGNLVQPEPLKNLLGRLTELRVPVHSCVIGARTDLQLPGVLAQRTGGVVLIDKSSAEADSPETMGRKLAAAVRAPVFYPDSIEVKPQPASLLPGVALPVRSDRETVYLGRGAVQGDLQVSVSGRLNGEEKSLNWHISAAERSKTNPVLAAVVERAEADGGLSSFLAGREMINLAERQFEGEIAGLLVRGERAVLTRNGEQAEAIGKLILDYSPQHPEAKILLEEADRLQGGRRWALAQAEPPRPGEAPAPGELQSREIPPEEPQDLVEFEAKRRRLIAQKLTLEVSRALDQVAGISGEDPAAAGDILKRVLSTLQETTDVDPAVRRQLIKRVQNALADVAVKEEIAEQAAIRATQKQAQADSARRLIREMQIEETRLQNLIEQVRAAIERGVHGDDNAYEEAEMVARVAVDTRPGNGPATAALFHAEAAGQVNKAWRLRTLRQDRFLETLYQVELSHVPFPDEPPILWPPAPVWKALTERRRKWAAVDLHQESPAEEKIRRELDNTTELDLIDMPFTDAIREIQELHGINIILDAPVLEEAGIDTNEVVNFTLSGIKLRSALNIILEQLTVPLAYVIEDETMKITTLEEHDARLSTRVYPVGDLVIPPSTLQQAGGGMMGGGMGGGMMGGGMGGGMMGGGMGGGMMGGGMGGMGGGGGMFSVPAEEFSHIHDSALIKKKP